MSNHQASYILRNVLKLMLKKDFFSNKTDEEKQDFIQAVMDLCQSYDGNEGEVMEDIAEELRYCYWCEKVVPTIHEGELFCSKCNLEQAQAGIPYLKNKYGSLDYFYHKDELTEQEEMVKRRWEETNAEIEKYKALVKEDFNE